MDDWRKEAACKDQPTEWWWEAAPPVGRKPNGFKWVSFPKARPICAQCPVKAECLEDADSFEIMAELRDRSAHIHGMRAGLTPFERYKRRSKAKKYEPVDRPLASHRVA